MIAVLVAATSCGGRSAACRHTPPLAVASADRRSPAAVGSCCRPPWVRRRASGRARQPECSKCGRFWLFEQSAGGCTTTRTRNSSERERAPVLEEPLARTTGLDGDCRGSPRHLGAVVALLSAACAAATDDPVVVTRTVNSRSSSNHRRRSPAAAQRRPRPRRRHRRCGSPQRLVVDWAFDFPTWRSLSAV